MDLSNYSKLRYGQNVLVFQGVEGVMVNQVVGCRVGPCPTREGGSHRVCEVDGDCSTAALGCVGWHRQASPLLLCEAALRCVARGAWGWFFSVIVSLAICLFCPNLAGITYTTAVIAPAIDNFNSALYDGTAYTGVFDGNGHAISNLTIDTAYVGNDYLVLFGQIEGSNAKIKNLGLKNVNITGGDKSHVLGGLCVSNIEGSISDCYFLNSTGLDNGLGTPLTDPNMKIQSSFVGYDYPRLAWQFNSPADFLRPGRVDHWDLMVLAHDWLCVDSRCGDIGPEGGDGIVNLFDYAEFVKYWLKE